MNHSEHDFQRYLSSKKSIEDRCLNHHVRMTLEAALDAYPGEGPLHVLEAGAGIGVMIERTLEWRLWRRADYLALDADPRNTDALPGRISTSAHSAGYGVEALESGALHIVASDCDLTVRTRCEDLFRFLDREEESAKWDLLIAGAFLDLVDLESSLPRLFSLIKPGGLFYFTITFDGVTIFEPVTDAGVEERILGAYHATMDQRIIDGRQSGHSRTGRRLIHVSQSCGADLPAAGASDWVVFARNGVYPADEAYFLRFIIHTIHQALKGREGVSSHELEEWVETRLGQIDAGRLVYIAHQIDVVGRIPI